MHARQAAHTVPPPAGPGRAAPLPVGSAGRDPQYVGPAVVFQVLTQLGARAVHLIAADEVQPHPVSEGLGEDVDGQLPLGAEDQALRHAHDRRFHRITDVLGRDPFPRADQRVPGAFPHMGQVHGIDPVGHLADAAQVLPLYPGGQPARLDLAATVSHTARLSSRWVLSGARSPICAAMVHPLRLGIWLVTAAAYLPACSHGPVRAKHGRSSPSSSASFRSASAAPILAAAAAFGCVVLTNA
jgi:hypothetical protein